MDIPSGGSLDQEKVVLHQELNTGDVWGVHSFFNKDFFNDIGAFSGMIVIFIAFANIVQQGRPEQ